MDISASDQENIISELSPLAYFFAFKSSVLGYKIQLVQKIGKQVNVPRLSLLDELIISKILGQRLAKTIIREEAISYFWVRYNEKGVASIRHPLSMMFCGPSGNGKTELVFELAELLNRPGDKAVLKIDGGKIKNSNEFRCISRSLRGFHTEQLCCKHSP